MGKWASQVALVAKDPPPMEEMHRMLAPSLGWDSPLEEGMATHSSILAWRMSWTEELGGLYSP